MKNLILRITVAVIAIPLFLWITMIGGLAFFILITIISSIALFEFYKLAEVKNAYPLKTLGIIAGIFLTGVCVYQELQVYIYQFYINLFDLKFDILSASEIILYTIIKLSLITLFIELFRKKGSPIINVATTIGGVVIIPLFFSSLILLRELFNTTNPNLTNTVGGYTIISIFASIWICDTAAYFGGKTFGKHKLFTSVSPNKTWEGAIFGFVFSIITMVVAKIVVLNYLSFLNAVIIGILVGIFGQIGDLIESKFKRDANIKDSSALIPGHGGMYDRFDSLVFLSPILFLYIKFIVGL